MPTRHDGRRFAVPASRRLTQDLLYFNHRVPLCGHDRIMNLNELAAARSNASERISWPALFLRAFGLVAREHPELRQTWYRWPFSHLYQHPESVASLTVHREWRGAPWLFWGQIPHPESLSLQEIQQRLDVFRDGDVPQTFRRQLQLARLPLVLRRLIWWWNLSVATQRRAKRMGTFFLSTLAGRSTEIQVPPSIHTGCLTYGPLDDRGCCRVTLAYDHRVMDGVAVAEILQKLEYVLTQQITVELQQSASDSQAKERAA